MYNGKPVIKNKKKIPLERPKSNQTKDFWPPMTLEVKGQKMKNAYIHPQNICTKFLKAQMTLSQQFSLMKRTDKASYRVASLLKRRYATELE